MNEPSRHPKSGGDFGRDENPTNHLSSEMMLKG